jgi:hypothetical protein
LEVRVLDRCDECGELKEGVSKRVSYWPNISAVCCAPCFADMTGEHGGYGEYGEYGASALQQVSDGEAD